jgi:hypothetical protein
MGAEQWGGCVRLVVAVPGPHVVMTARGVI